MQLTDYVKAVEDSRERLSAKQMTTKGLNYYLSLRYKIELIPQEDGSWGAVIAELPGCVGGGDTIFEALEMLNDAKRGWFVSSLKHGDSIPEPMLSVTDSAA